MGGRSSSTQKHQQSNVEGHEQFQFRFTDCSCKCDANKRRIEDIYQQNDLPQAAILTALISQISRPQYDINCHCDCGEGVKFGFLFGNISSNLQATMNHDRSE